MLFIYFQGKIEFSHCIWLIWFNFEHLYLFGSAILLSNMKSLFFCLRKFSKFLMSFLKAQLSFPSNFASIFSAIRPNSSLLFKLKHYIFWSLLKIAFFRFLSAWVKDFQISCVNFELTSQFCIILYCHV